MTLHLGRVAAGLHSWNPAMYKDKRILVSWYTDPNYIPPFVLSNRQITLGVKLRPEQAQGMLDGFTPPGSYDLLAALEASSLPTQFDAIVVAADSTMTNLPANLEAFDCPKILLVGDTQHFSKPIGKLVQYAQASRYDYIISGNNRQHLHWFIEAGFTNVAWMPGIKMLTRSRPFTPERKPQVCFFGRKGKYHVLRTKFLAELERRNAFELALMEGSPEAAADAYANSAVSLNYSLNGDLNMRVFEVLSAGGCLLTDRLSKQSGLDLLLEEGKEFVGYDSVDECIEQARFLLDHPQTALTIARAGNAAFMSRLQPEQRIEQLLHWVFGGQIDSFFQVRDFPQPQAAGPSLADRIRVYEDLQEIHRVRKDPAALIMNDVPEIHILDALDLRHLKFSIVNKDATPMRPKVAAIAERCIMTKLGEKQWDCLIATDPETGHTAVIKSQSMGNAALPQRKFTTIWLKSVVWRKVKAALAWGHA